MRQSTFSRQEGRQLLPWYRPFVIMWVLQSTLSTEMGCGAHFIRTSGHVGCRKWVLLSTLSTKVGCDAHLDEISRLPHALFVDEAFTFYCLGVFVQMVWMLRPILVCELGVYFLSLIWCGIHYNWKCASTISWCRVVLVVAIPY